MAKKVIETEKTKWLDWHHYCFSFLELSQLGLEKLLADNFATKELGEKLVYPYKNIPVAICYYIKHALELGLKQPVVMSKGQYQNDHNQLNLLSILKDQCEVKEPELFKKLSELITKYISGNFYDGKLKIADIIDSENTQYRYPNKNIILVEDEQKGIYALNHKDFYLLLEDVKDIKKLLLQLLSRMYNKNNT
jgi:hypothetical protein